MLRKLLNFLTPRNDFPSDLPSVAEARWITDSVRYSPDLGYLEQFQYQLLFVTDELRHKHPHNALLEDSPLLCGAYTEKTYAFWMQEFPIIGTGETELRGIPLRQDGDPSLSWMAPSLRIKGELYAVPPRYFQKIDEYKKNTEVFRRQRINVLVPYKVFQQDNGHDQFGRPLPAPLQGADVKGKRTFVFQGTHPIRCWMYVGIPEYWNDLPLADFRGFKTVNNYESRRKNSWLTRYYDFPRPSIQSG